MKRVTYYTTTTAARITGHITVVDDKLVFVDDTHPVALTASFAERLM